MLFDKIKIPHMIFQGGFAQFPSEVVDVFNLSGSVESDMGQLLLVVGN